MYTLIAAMIGGKLFGIIGIIFFIPLAAVAVKLVKEDAAKRLHCFHIWLLHSAVPEENLQRLTEYCSNLRMTLAPIQVKRSLFENAPVSKQFLRQGL